MTAPSLHLSAPRVARRAALAASAAVTTLAWCAAAHALPVVGTAGGLVGGSGSISTSGNTETINQTSPRALIQWASFNVAGNETVQFNQPSSSSITFNVIPFSFNTQANIQGTINATGGVWLYSPRGVIIGNGATIDVGSLVVTTGTTNYTLQEGSPGNFPMPPELNGNTIDIFGATASIDVQSGATIKAGVGGTGFVMLNSEAITQNGSVTATDGVAYAVGDAANVTFTPNDGGLALDGVDVSGSNPGEPNLNQGGSTKGAWVGVYAPDSVLEGFSSVINMGGTTEATGFAPSSALNTAVLLVGSNDAGPQNNFDNTVTDVNTENGTITADEGSVSINSGQAELGNITTPSPFGSITVEVGGDPSVPGGPGTNPGSITLNYFATLSAGKQVYLGSELGPVNLLYGSIIQSDSGGAGEGGVYIEGQSVNADPSSLIYTGSSQTQLEDDVTIYADGGPLQSGQIDGNNVWLEARGPGFVGIDGESSGEGPGSDLTIAGNINAASTITGFSDFGNVTVNPGVTLTSFGTGAGGTGTASIYLSAANNLDIEGNVIGSGSVSLTATNGNVTIGTNPNDPFPVLIQSDSGGADVVDGVGTGTLSVTAGGYVNAAGGSELRGGQSATSPTDPVTVTTEDGDLTIGMVNGSDVTLTTAEGDNLTVNGAVYGSDSVTFDPATVTLNANVTSGGTLDINASSSITITAGVTVRSDSFGDGTGTLTLEAPKITADATSLLVAGPVGGSPTSTVSATTTTGDLTVGQVSGTQVTLTAGTNSETGGNLTINGAVLGTGTGSGVVTITATAGKVDVEANVISGGGISISAGSDIDVGTAKGAPTVLINSNSNDKAKVGSGTITLTATLGVNAAGSSELRSGSEAGDPDDAVTVTANDGDLTIGKVEGTDVTLITGDDLTINGAVFGSTSVSLDPAELFPQNIAINADVTSGGPLDVTATNNVTVAAKVTVQSAGDLTVTAGNSIDADATSLLTAGSDPTAPTGKVTITAAAGTGTVTPGTLTLGQVSGTVVKIVDGTPLISDCEEDCGPTGGDVSLGGAILGTTSVTATAYNGGIDVEANVISAGPVTLDAANDIDIGLSASGVLIQSDSGGAGKGAVSIDAGGAVDADGSSEVRGGATAAAPGDNVTITAEGGDLTSGQVEGTNVTLSTGDDLTIAGAVYGSQTVTFDPANVIINANVTSGGTLSVSATNSITVNAGVTVKSAGDMTFDAGSFITADATSLIVAGSDANTPTGDVTITAEGGDLSLGQVTGNNVTLNSGIDAESDAGGNVNLLGKVFGTDSVTVNAFIGTIDVEGNVISGGPIAMTAGLDIDVGTDKGGPTVLIQSDTSGSGAGTILLTAGRIYNAAASSELLAGGAAASPDDAVTVIAEDGNLTTGKVEGTDVTLTTAKGDDLTINGAVYGSKTVTFDPANVFINADVTSGGTLAITATNTINVSAGVTVRSDNNGAGTGNLTLTADTISADPASSLIAGPNNSSPPTANVTAIANTGDLSVGAVTGKVVSLTAAGDLTVAGAVLGTTDVAMISGGDTDVDGAVASNGFVTDQSGGDVTVAGGDSITAGSYIHIKATDGVTLGAAAVLRSNAKDANAASATADVNVDAGTNYNADPTSVVVAGSSASAPTNNVTILAGDNENGTGGNLTAGQTSGVDVHLTADGATAEGGGAGNLTIVGAVFGSQGVFAYSDLGNTGTLPGSTTVSANVTGNGIIDIRSQGAGGLTLNTGEGSGPTLVTSSAGEVYLYSNHALTVDPNVQVTGVSMDVVAQGLLSVDAGASLATTGSTTAPAWPLVPQSVVAGSGNAAPTVTSLNLAAGTIRLAGSVTSGKAGSRDDIYIEALGAPSLVTVGGASGPAGFDLTAASFGELTGRNVVVMAGPGEGVAGNANLQLANLAIDPSLVQGLWLGTASGQSISVTGAVTGAGVNLELGFAVDPTNALGGYIPGEIDITGSLGTTLNPMGSVGMLARNNIFMGTSGFITAAQGDSTFDAVTQSKNYSGLSQGYVFVAANTLEMGAEGRIIQQNTSTLTGVGQQQFAGLAINAPTSGTPLIVAPAGLTGATIGSSGGWSANFGAGPTKIDVFGVLRQTNSTLVSGVDAALLPNLLDTAIHTSSAYRINSCVFGTDCSPTTPTNPLAPYQGVKDTLSFQPPQDPSNDYIVIPTITTFVSNIVISDTDFADTLKNGAPVTESGNGDLWNGPSCPPGQEKCPGGN